MSNNEFKPLDEVTVNGRVYVDKVQLLQLIRDEKRKCTEGTETGYIMPKKKQRIAATLALNHLATLVDKRRYNRIHEEINDPRYVVLATGSPDGNFLYFRGWCELVEPGKSTPVYSEDPNDAVLYETKDAAQMAIWEIQGKDLWPIRTTMLITKANIRALHFALGWPDDKDADKIMERETIFHPELTPERDQKPDTDE